MNKTPGKAGVSVHGSELKSLSASRPKLKASDAAKARLQLLLWCAWWQKGVRA